MRLHRPPRSLIACLAAAVGLACPSRGAGPRPLVVTGPAPYLDPAAPRTKRGAVIVAVRPSNAPERAIEEGATVVLEPPQGARPIGAYTGADGVARFDTVPAGAYVLRVRRVGYKAHALRVTVREGCPQHVEVYLEPAGSCLFESCPQVPARATITTCAPAT